jgi:hypothetical protein
MVIAATLVAGLVGYELRASKELNLAAERYRSIDMAKKRRKLAWSAEQVRTLKSMAKKKTPASKIAKSLKRTESATRQKAFSMGLSLNSRD